MMIRGFTQTTSLTTIAAAAGLLMGGFAYAPAIAADLGGGCCADLEERVAELEATTARKGNRVVSLQIYGQVNKAFLFHDTDLGTDDDVYIVDNDTSGSRFGFRGEASLRPGWKAGFNIELDYQDAASDLVDAGNVLNSAGDDVSVFDDPVDEIRIRMNYLYVESEAWGRISLGQQSTTADGAAEVVLGNSLSNASIYIGNSFTVVEGSFIDPTFASLDLGNFVTSLDGGRNDVVRYDSPSFYGFIVSASWGDDDYYDVALRFKKEWNSIRIAAAFAYASFDDDNDDDGSGQLEFDNYIGSISVMHIPTGLYGAFAAGTAEQADDIEGNYWYIQLGLERRFLPHGSTTIYGEYGQYNDFAQGFEADLVEINGLLFADIITSSQVDRWGFGIVQKFDSAALEIYAQATFWDVEADVNDIVEGGTYTLGSDVSTVLVGSRIRF